MTNEQFMMEHLQDVLKFQGVFKDLFQHIFNSGNDEIKNYQWERIFCKVKGT